MVPGSEAACGAAEVEVLRGVELAVRLASATETNRVARSVAAAGAGQKAEDPCGGRSEVVCGGLLVVEVFEGRSGEAVACLVDS